MGLPPALLDLHQPAALLRQVDALVGQIAGKPTRSAIKVP